MNPLDIAVIVASQIFMFLLILVGVILFMDNEESRDFKLWKAILITLSIMLGLAVFM